MAIFKVTLYSSVPDREPISIFRIGTTRNEVMSTTAEQIQEGFAFTILNTDRSTTVMAPFVERFTVEPANDQ